MPATAPRRCRRRIADKLQVHRRPAADFWEITFILSAPSRRQLFTKKYTSQTSRRHAFRGSGDGDRSGELNPIQLLRFDAESASESATYLRCVCDICSYIREGIGDHLADTSQAWLRYMWTKLKVRMQPELAGTGVTTHWTANTRRWVVRSFLSNNSLRV